MFSVPRLEVPVVVRIVWWNIWGISKASPELRAKDQKSPEIKNEL